MKITGGQAKGIPIKVSNKSVVRPATDYLRQAVFSSLGSLVIDANFIDLFAGTGSYGLEAWSRGAQSGLFVEKDRNCLVTLRQNIDAVGKSAERNLFSCKIFHSDVFTTSIPRAHQFDLIFADPPYEITEKIFVELLQLAATWLKKDPGSRLIIEAPGQLPPPLHPNLVLLKKLGKNKKNSPSAFIWGYR